MSSHACPTPAVAGASELYLGLGGSSPDTYAPALQRWDLLQALSASEAVHLPHDRWHDCASEGRAQVGAQQRPADHGLAACRWAQYRRHLPSRLPDLFQARPVHTLLPCTAGSGRGQQ
ncbi:hypothetical protein V493_07808 [Pseudogymnoascus sp. VKM F-4281 (FW-2241)]|nr:hypothetical protein V493_07808 [Pseudogymnoascus sp. VKM F-4281 (FW-2241)]